MTQDQLLTKYTLPMNKILGVVNQELSTAIAQEQSFYGLPRKMSGDSFHVSYKLRDMNDSEKIRILALNIHEWEYEMCGAEFAFSANAKPRIIGEIRAFWSGHNSASERIAFIA